jgi:hypothetical protein
MFFIPKKLVLHCYTNKIAVSEIAPIAKANDFLPEWWKKTPKNIVNEKRIVSAKTIKSCPGFTDLYSKGAIIPMWSDVTIQVGQIGSDFCKYDFSDRESQIEFHSNQQRGEYLTQEKHQHIKFMSPWRFYCEEDVDFLFMEPTWNMENLNVVKIMPGVVNFKYMHATHINTMWIRHNETYNFEIPLLQPMAHIVPIDGRELVVKVHYDVEKFMYYQEMSFPRTSFRNLKKIRQSNEKKGCPFGFGS